MNTESNQSYKDKMLAQFARSRAVSTPLVFLSTPDAAATVAAIAGHARQSNTVCPFLHWDVVRGVQTIADAFDLDKDPLSQTAASLMGDDCGVGNIVEALSVARHNLPEDGVLFLSNAHLFLCDSPMALQAMWNLRDPFKSNGRTLVALAPAWKVPLELSNDVLQLDEPLPSPAELETLIRSHYDAARESNREMPDLDGEVLERAVDATVGLSAFPAEQVLSLSLTKRGVDETSLWERKRKLIEATPGLSVYRGGESFRDVAGNENAKRFLSRLIEKSRNPIRCVLWLDEIEKMFAGLGHNGQSGDANGLQADKLQQLLTWMEERKVPAVLMIGFPGTGKSLIAKATGAQAGCPTVQADLGAMSGSLVGQSEAMVRGFIKTVDALAPANGDGASGALIVATCNNVGAMPPEFLSRFRRGQFFFDLPSSDERGAMWNLHLAKNELTEVVTFDESDWTGREIEACCTIAAELQLPLAEAAGYVVPISRTMGAGVHALREMAANRFLSASYAGAYQLAPQVAPVPARGRKITVGS